MAKINWNKPKQNKYMTDLALFTFKRDIDWQQGVNAPNSALPYKDKRCVSRKGAHTASRK